MDKPISLPMKEYLVRRLAVKLMVPEKTIDAVIVHQFQSANAALTSNDSIEISGFGKFIFNRNKAIKTLEKYKAFVAAYKKQLLAPDITEAKRRVLNLKIDGISEEIDILSNKLQTNEPVTDLRGMEEQAASSRTPEGNHQEDERREDEDM